MLKPYSGEVQLATGEESSPLHAAGDFHVLVATRIRRVLFHQKCEEDDRIIRCSNGAVSLREQTERSRLKIWDGVSREGLSKPSSHTEVQFPGAPLTKSQASIC